MPLYEYECEKCHHRFERIQKFSDPPIADCPVCGGPVHKLMSSPAIQFKGSGWYITDYARKDGASSGKTGQSEGSSTSEKTSKESTDGPKEGRTTEGKAPKDSKESKDQGKSASSSDKGTSTSGSSTSSSAPDS
jgi:putative FmdB family regulatory protein